MLQSGIIWIPLPGGKRAASEKLPNAWAESLYGWEAGTRAGAQPRRSTPNRLLVLPKRKRYMYRLYCYKMGWRATPGLVKGHQHCAGGIPEGDTLREKLDTG